MNALILAAGLGSRMGYLTKTHPKSMVKLGNQTLLQKMLSNLALARIKRVTIVIGYEGEQIKKHIGNKFENIEITFIENDKYKTRNNIYSIWLGREYLANDDSIIIEGDIICGSKFMRKIINRNENIVSVIPYSPWMNGSAISIDQLGNFNFTKTSLWDNTSNLFKTANIYRFTMEFSKNIFLPLIEKNIKEKKYDLFYEDILTSEILNNHFIVETINENDKWNEIDTPLDYLNTSLLYSSINNRYISLANCYGGHWRLPQIKDFYYLTNPFFPPEKLLNELKYALFDLIINYPSGRIIVDDLAAAIFNCDSRNLIVSNGASEIIGALLKTLKGTFGIITPTFEEYINRLDIHAIIEFKSIKKNFSFSLKELKELSNTVNNIILTNPNNPTGAVFSKADLIVLLEYLKEKNKNLIIDESFADFSESKISLIDQSILNNFSNLYIIKSMGKSYGIPGIRLGLLFSSNTTICNNLKKNVPIWNINSIAEYFLEILPRYKEEFHQSCKKVQLEREKLFYGLKKIKQITPIVSQGNFILIKLNCNIESPKLALSLLNKFGVFVKDCSSKKGFNNESYIRVAVKSKEDNECLINALKDILTSEK